MNISMVIMRCFFMPGNQDYGRSYGNPCSIPKVVYCHDMAGGYLKADREFGMTDVYPAFRFTRWHLIDVFVYFSHHFITLPPLTWINLAHRSVFNILTNLDVSLIFITFMNPVPSFIFIF